MKFHKGEEAVQKLTGNSKMASRVGRMIQESIQPGVIPFLKNQLMVILTSTDKDGKLWSSPLMGEIGFIDISSFNEVVLDLDKVYSDKGDIFFENITQNNQVAMLFIEHSMRARFRVNGTVTRVDNKVFIQVKEAYGNCPKYINSISIKIDHQKEGANFSTGDNLNDTEKDWIQAADTFYLATSNNDGRSDASHRGGNKGFVEILYDGVLRIPDYPGNNMFNSLGNIYENPNAGLLFIDFEKGETLQLSGKAELSFDQDTEADLNISGGTGRFWLFRTEKWIKTRHSQKIDWKFIEYSPFNPDVKG